MRSKLWFALALAGTLASSMFDAASFAGEARLELPPQPLSAALRALGNQTKTNILFDPAAVRDLDAPAVTDAMSVEDALVKLLEGSGLTFRFIDAHTVTLIPADAAAGTKKSLAVPERSSPERIRWAQADAPRGPAVQQRRETQLEPAHVPRVDAPSDLEEVEEVVVTGSRVARPGFTSATPITTLGEEDLAARAATNIADAINDIPSLRETATPNNTNTSTNSAGNYLDLRGLGINRTLVLVDGKRFVPTNIGGSVNLNIVPQTLIRSVDVVTGGASAAYGSDAISGVVNLRYNHALEGFKGKFQGGGTEHGDYRNLLASMAYGESFAGGRGKILLAGEAFENSGVKSLGERDWGARNSDRIANPASTATNSEPQFIMVEDARYANASYGGVITSPGRLRGIQFAPDGSPLPFNYGSVLTATTMSGGDGVPINEDNVLSPAQKRFSGFARVSYDVRDDLQVHAEYSHASDRMDFPGLTGTETVTIRRDNAFLPESIRATMLDNNIASFSLGRSIEDNTRIQYRMRTKTDRIAVGLDGALGEGWSWDAYYAYGRTENHLPATNARIASRFALATDAVLNAATEQIVCRSTLTSPDNGCVPIDLFGYGAPSAAALGWVNGESWRNWDIRLHVAALNVRGAPFSIWAGPVSVALGGEWRRETMGVTSDMFSQNREFRTGNVIPWSGAVSVKEAYAEAVVPLLIDAPVAKSLELNVAARGTDYSTSGTVATWKVGLNHAVNDSIRLRATRSRDIRAPSENELFSLGGTGVATIADPLLGQTYSYQSVAVGNLNLEPEEADTVTAGIVLTPGFVRGLRLSVDYFDIKIGDAIVTTAASEVINRCHTDMPALCGYITRDPTTNRIVSVQVSGQNVESRTARGVDFEAGYHLPAFGGTLDMRALATYYDSLQIDTGRAVTEYAGTVASSGVPHWRVRGTAGFRTVRYNVSLAARYVGGGLIAPGATPKNYAPLHINGRVYFDLSGELPLVKRRDHRITLYALIRNLTDEDPPQTGALEGYGTTRQLFDIIGRHYSLGARMTF